jgi:hypothetical protein
MATASVTCTLGSDQLEALSHWWECSLSVDTLSQCAYSYGCENHQAGLGRYSYGELPIDR